MKYFPIIIILIVVSLIFLAFLQKNFESPQQNYYKNPYATKNEDKNNEKDKNMETSDYETEQNIEEQTTEDLEEQTNANLNCNRKISYSLTDLNQSIKCSSFQNNACINKEISCKIKVKNLDSTISGEFQIKFFIYEAQTENRLSQKIIEKEISPAEIEIFGTTFQIQKENANKELSCGFLTEKVPTKNVCN